jgi:hypothetical protein
MANLVYHTVSRDDKEKHKPVTVAKYKRAG